MDIMYSKMLWAINIIDAGRTDLSSYNQGVVISLARKPTVMQWPTHVFVRQHIRPEEDLVQKTQALRSLLGCLSMHRMSTQVAFHFSFMHLINHPQYPTKKKADYNWQLFELELRGLFLGERPQFRVSDYWLESEGIERFERLAASLGGVVNGADQIYW